MRTLYALRRCVPIRINWLVFRGYPYLECFRIDGQLLVLLDRRLGANKDRAALAMGVIGVVVDQVELVISGIDDDVLQSWVVCALLFASDEGTSPIYILAVRKANQINLRPDQTEKLAEGQSRCGGVSLS